MTLTLAAAGIDYTDLLADALARNATEALCECGVYLAYNPLTGRLVHVGGCRFCFDPATCERDPVCLDTRHTCPKVRPVLCGHGCDKPAKPIGDSCLGGLADCCHCCQPADFDPDTYYL